MVNKTVSSPTDTVPYHQQDTNHWCGAACTLMVLHSLGVTKSGGFALDQKRVRSVAHNSSRSDPSYQWVAAPDGLTAALNYFCEKSDVMLADTKGASRRWELVAADSEEEISRYIVWTLWTYKAPVVALVFGMMHWIVVGGCVTSRPPRSADDTGYEILGFHISDPWPPIPHDLARNDRFRHVHQRDESGGVFMADGCGTGWAGDLADDTLGGRGVATRFVSYNDWRVRDHSTPGRRRHSGYMLGVPPTLTLTQKPGKPQIKVRSKWIGKFVAICDPISATAEVEQSIASNLNMERILTGLAPRNARGEDAVSGKMLRMITPEEAIEIALSSIDEYRSYPPNGRTMTPAKQVEHDTLAADEPILVDWLDEPGSYLPEAAYYMIPFRSNGVQHTVVRVAAHMPCWLWDKEDEDREKKKLFLGLNILQETHEGCSDRNGRTAAAIISREQALAAIVGHTFRGTQGGGIRVSKEYRTEGKLVWKPCLESFDPCCPFYEFAIPAPGRPTDTHYLYVRAFDGKVFAHLTEHLAGA